MAAANDMFPIGTRIKKGDFDSVRYEVEFQVAFTFRVFVVSIV